MRRILVLLTTLSLAGALAAPAAAFAASGKVISVGPPSGGDDTAAIQTALNGCIGAGPGCVVQLRAGTYHSRQLYAANFRGTFRGMGMTRTTLAAPSQLTVNWDDPSTVPAWCTPGTPLDTGGTCSWPVYIDFEGGSVTLTGLTVDVSQTTIDPYAWYDDQYGNPTTSIDLFMALNFGGAATRIDATVDGVALRGGMDTASGGIFGSDLNTYSGINYDNPGATGGSFVVRNSSVQTVAFGLTPGPVVNAPVTITGNAISDVDFGISANGPSGRFTITSNRIRADNLDPAEWTHTGILLSPSGLEGPGSSSTALISANAITVADTCGCDMHGINIADAVQGPTGSHWLTASVVGNTISLPSTVTTLTDNWKDGIELQNTTGSSVIGNAISATPTGAGAAIGIFGNFWGYGTPEASKNVVLGNDVHRFVPGGDVVLDWFAPILPGIGLSRYYLDGWTSHNTVICTSKSDTSIDNGTGNHLVNCTKVAVPAMAAVTPLVTSHASNSCHAATLPKRLP